MQLTQFHQDLLFLAQCDARLTDGRSCPWRPSSVADGIALCKFHATPSREVAPPPPVQALQPAEVGALMRSALPQIVVRNPDSVVYYVGDPDSQLVKIGTSTALKGRVRRFRIRRPGAVLLATEPGTYPIERKRHHQFRALREPLPSGETEWFRKAPQLMEHVGQLRRKYGVLCPGRPIYSSWIAPLRY